MVAATGDGGDAGEPADLHRGPLVGLRAVAQGVVAVEAPGPDRAVGLQGQAVQVAGGHRHGIAEAHHLHREVAVGRGPRAQLAVGVVAPGPDRAVIGHRQAVPGARRQGGPAGGAARRRRAAVGHRLGRGQGHPLPACVVLVAGGAGQRRVHLADQAAVVRRLRTEAAGHHVATGVHGAAAGPGALRRLALVRGRRRVVVDHIAGAVRRVARAGGVAIGGQRLGLVAEHVEQPAVAGGPGRGGHRAVARHGVVHRRRLAEVAHGVQRPVAIGGLLRRAAGRDPAAGRDRRLAQALRLHQQLPLGVVGGAGVLRGQPAVVPGEPAEVVVRLARGRLDAARAGGVPGLLRAVQIMVGGVALVDLAHRAAGVDAGEALPFAAPVGGHPAVLAAPAGGDLLARLADIGDRRAGPGPVAEGGQALQAQVGAGAAIREAAVLPLEVAGTAELAAARSGRGAAAVRAVAVGVRAPRRQVDHLAEVVVRVQQVLGGAPARVPDVGLGVARVAEQEGPAAGGVEADRARGRDRGVAGARLVHHPQVPQGHPRRRLLLVEVAQGHPGAVDRGQKMAVGTELVADPVGAHRPEADDQRQR